MNIDLLGSLAGFILAHSALIGSGQDGRPIAPYAIYQYGEERRAENYPAESQEEAVANMQLGIKKVQNDVDGWASAQEGYVELDGGQQLDIYLVKIWVKGAAEPLRIYQAFDPTPFKLRGNLKVLNFEGVGLKNEQAEQFQFALDSGIDSHPTASEMWNSWFQ